MQKMKSLGWILQKREVARKNFVFLLSLVMILALSVFPRETRGQDAQGPQLSDKANLSAGLQIVFDRGLLSVSLKNADLEEALKEISRQAEVKIEVTPPLKERITVEFVDLPLKQGLRRLLKNQNYFMYLEKKDITDKETQYILSRIVLLGKSNSSQRENTQILAASEEADLSPSSQNISSLTEIQIPPDLIDELLSQTPEAQVQANDLKTLVETINNSLKEINPQLLKALEQSGKKEERNSGLEALERLLGEGEIGKINPMITE
jgi:hypothetical protein